MYTQILCTYYFACKYILKYHTKILEVNLFAFAYRLFHEDFSSIDETCVALESLCIKAPHRALYHLWFQNTYELYYMPDIMYMILLWDKMYTQTLLYSKMVPVPLS